jgi:hypothetical protein
MGSVESTRVIDTVLARVVHVQQYVIYIISQLHPPLIGLVKEKIVSLLAYPDHRHGTKGWQADENT